MQYNKIFSRAFGPVMMLAVVATGCQKMERPDFSDYPPDTNPPGGPLNFYAAFDGTTTDPLMNAVDSIRANFPADNPLASVDGISGKAVKGATQKFIKYAKPNDWIATSKSFTISSWFKKDGQTQNNGGGDGPEYIMSLRTSKEYNWSNGNLIFFLEGNNTACAVKMYLVSKNGDTWVTWEGGNSIAGLLDNKWHHIAVTYNHTSSTFTLFIDGVANPLTRSWGSHGELNLDNSQITEFRVGRGPRNDSDGDGANGWLQSSWKGELDQLRLYSSALTASEVQGLFTGKK